jgi:signal transduction histidine kinase
MPLPVAGLLAALSGAALLATAGRAAHWLTVTGLTLALALSVLLLTLLAWQSGHEQARAALQAVERQREAWLRLQPGLAWRSDASHRLHWMQQATPEATGDDTPLPCTIGQPCWHGLDDDAHSLRQRLEGQGAIEALVVRPHAADATGEPPGPTGWLLRAEALHDADGAFAGHCGLLLPLPAEAGCARDARAESPTLATAADAATSAAAGRSAVAPSPGLPLATGAASVDAETARALAAEYASFSYTISHDLRAPIRVVEGFARILKEDHASGLDRVGNDHLDRILGAAARMNHMIDALLSLSQLSTRPLARQRVHLSRIAGYVLDDLRRQNPAREVQIHIADDLQADGDPTLLRMVLENLLGNAWKYSAKVGRAELRFERAWQSGRAVFVVSDNGAGFDMRFADRLFGVFQRLHSSSDFAGTGVGLASVRRIVRRHGGDIWADSEPGRGARFYFTLGEGSGSF